MNPHKPVFGRLRANQHGCLTMTYPRFGRCGRDARAPSVHYQTHSNQSKADIPFGDFVSSKGISLANRIPAFLQEGSGALNQPLGNITELTMPAPPRGIHGWDPHPDSNLFIPRTIVPGPDVASSMVLRSAPIISDFDVDRGFYAKFLGFEKAGNAVRLYFAFIRACLISPK